MDGPEVNRYGELLAFFRRNGVLREAVRGEVLAGPNTPTAGAFYIEEGFVKAYGQNSRGDQHLHMIYGPQEYFPLLYIDRKARRAVTYEALTACRLLEVLPAKLEAALLAKRRLSMEMIELAAEQLAMSFDRINNLQYRFARERLIDCLLFLGQRFGVTSGAGYEIMLRISHQTLASNVNLSRESVSREIDRLARKDLLEIHEGRIILKDVPGLRAQLPEAVPGERPWRFWQASVEPEMS
jgi:CRP/FNR family transcriptional regulator